MSGIPSINPQEARRCLKQGTAVLIDVREVSEFEKERIAEAINVPMSAFDVDAVVKTAGEKQIIFQCQVGKRAADCARYFSEHTGRDCVCLEGSLNGWKQAGFACISSE